MATKRTPLRRDIKRWISPAAIDAFKAGDRMGLYHALALKPWQPNPLEVDGPEPPEWGSGTAWVADWPMMWEIRQDLEAACK
ncbi:hypothetical protein [Mesorhizobium kowhaii]|uniref:hypothetical protein n=1 Tax=Mesorhizobium kowhaii TaxID=1300272 RepID=UPI00142D3217|nr:hypothetical protein [Mesorhizobium kowhaii]